MDVRVLGDGGPALSVVGLGCNNFGTRIDASATAQVVAAALEAGVTHFDTAEMYGDGQSESFLGTALGTRRDEAVIATKFLPRPADEAYVPGVLARRIRAACEGSLRRLGTDRIDLYYQHYPDADAPIEEALEALSELVAAGKVLHIASSNVTGQQIAEAAGAATASDWPSFCGVQAEWNLLSRGIEADVVPAAQQHSMGVVPYFPLASGMLTGKYRRAEPFPAGSRLAGSDRFARVASDDNFDKVERLERLASAHDRTLLELAFAWLLARAEVTSVIAGATSAAQVAANAAAAAWVLTAEEVAAVDHVLAGE